MFRFTKLLIEPKFNGYSSNVALLKHNLEFLCNGRTGGKEVLRNCFYRYYGSFFTSHVVAESHQNKKNFNNGVHVYNLPNERKMSGTSTGTTDDKDKLKAETVQKEPAPEQSKGVTVKRRRYIRNFPRIKFQSIEDKTHRASVKKRSRKHILDPPKQNVTDTANVESSTKTTDKSAEGESNVLNELSESIEKAQQSKAKEPLKQVHIEYIESVNRNPDDAMRDSDNIDAKPDSNLIKKIEEQINDPMIIKLILRSQLVPEPSDKTETTKSEEESSNTLLDSQIHDTQKRYSDHNKKPTNEPRIRIILPPDESNNSYITPAQSNEQSKSEPATTNMKIIKKSEGSVPQPAIEDDDIVAKKMALRTSTEAEVLKNISVKLDSPIKVRKDNPWSGKQNTQTWFEKKAEKIKMKARVDTKNETLLTNTEQTLEHKANKLNDFLDNKSKTVSITDNISYKRDDSTSGHMYKDQATKLGDLLNARPETVITDKSKSFQTRKSEATRGANVTVGSGAVGGSGSGSGGGKSRGTTAHYIREKPSKVKVYLRNVSYLLMTIIGSFSIYYLAEMLSHEEALSLAFLSDWQNKEASLAMDAEDESQEDILEDGMELEALDLSLLKQGEESLQIVEAEINEGEDKLYVGEEGY